MCTYAQSILQLYKTKIVQDLLIPNQSILILIYGILNTNQPRILIISLPCHVCISGNEIAVKTAVEATELEEITNIPRIVLDLKNIIKNNIKEK